MQRIVWAIDALAENETHHPHARAARLIATLTKGHPAYVEPVCAYAPFGSLPIAAFDDPNGSAKTESKEKLDDLLSHVKLEGLTEPHLVASSGPSLRDKARAVIDYARDHNADCVVLSTRAATGVKRLIMGSFAETMALYSEVPVFAVGPRTPVGVPFESVLFPTDFSEQSHEAFRALLPLARELECEVTLYYKAQYWTEYFPSGTLLPAYITLDGQSLPIQHDKAEEWAKEGEAAGVKVTPLLDDTPGMVAEAVLAKAEQMPNPFIAMACQTGSVASAILGSVTRQVIRHANCPVWVMHPQLH